jgi:organic hydroperoxide reductase OsmC/OhrA
MSQHLSTEIWERKGQAFESKTYCRDHRVEFEDGQIIAASGAAGSLPPDTVGGQTADPEEMFVASLASCHMLWLLAIAARKGFIVDRYEDHASRELANEAGRTWMKQVCLRPRVVFSGDKQPTFEEREAMHDEAHRRCFIANSVKTTVSVEPERG